MHRTLCDPPLVLDHRRFIPAPPSVITAESWEKRNALADRYYPDIMDLLAFGEDRLWGILWEVEQDEKPAREFPVGAAGATYPLAWLPKRSWLEWHLFRGAAPAARRAAIPAHVRDFVLNRDGNVCQICHGEVEPDDIHLDHIHPWSRGGPDTAANLRVTHSTCNLRKGARTDGA